MQPAAIIGAGTAPISRGSTTRNYKWHASDGRSAILDRVDAVALDDELRKVIEMVVVAGSTAATKWVL